MKKYSKPIVEVETIQVEQIIAGSLKVHDTVTQSEQLSNGRRRAWDNGWD